MPTDYIQHYKCFIKLKITNYARDAYIYDKTVFVCEIQQNNKMGIMMPNW